MLMALTFKVSKDLVEMMDRCIDDVAYRSRGQILNIALAEWLARHLDPHVQTVQRSVEHSNRQMDERQRHIETFTRLLRKDPTITTEERESLFQAMQRGIEKYAKKKQWLTSPPSDPEPTAVDKSITENLWTIREQLKAEIIEELRAEIGNALSTLGGGNDDRTETARRKASKPPKGG